MSAHYFQEAIDDLSGKRSEIVEEIRSLELQIRATYKDLANIDSILELLNPETKPVRMTYKGPTRYLHLFRQGELRATLLDVLRASVKPMSCRDLTQAIISSGQYEQGLWEAIRRRVRGCLQNLEIQGCALKQGEGKNALWSLRREDA